ncbi:glycosyltransferase family 4 protein [Flavihumibacter sp. R14]|nr:glycosyltransferase family 4 protein [Flavihumibacter soli]
MKIGFDGKRAVQNFTGLGNYSRYIIDILAEYFPSNEYRVYSPREPDRQKQENLGNNSPVSFHYPKHKGFKSFWRSYGIIDDLKNDGVQVYHGLSNEIPFGIKGAGIASVVTIHDLIFLRYPQYYPLFDRKMYKFKFRNACRNADKIIAISEQTKRDIISYFNINEDRIEVIYQNCDKSFRKEPSADELERVRKTYNLPARYLLNVGTIESRKNLLLIVQALRKVDTNIHLVVIGRKTAYAEKVHGYIAENGLIDRVHFLSNVSQEDLPGIYRQSALFVFPSEFEGFGIPIIEALHSRVPVIAAKGSCLEEAGGPESIYVSPTDDTELAEAIHSVLANPDKRKRMIEAGAEHLKQFDDKQIAQKLINVYQTINLNAKRRS